MEFFSFSIIFGPMYDAIMWPGGPKRGVLKQPSYILNDAGHDVNRCAKEL